MSIKQPDYTFYSDVKDGKFQPSVTKKILATLSQYEGKRIEIRIRKQKSTRTDKQNKLWWVYMNILEDETGMDAKELHGICKKLFLNKKVELVNKETGEIHEAEGEATTTTLSRSEFAELIDKLQKWAADFLGVYLPSPDEQMELNIDEKDSTV